MSDAEVPAIKASWVKGGAPPTVSVRQNNDAHGGQDVVRHLFRFIPRFADDGFKRQRRPVSV
jgi:hypothetical protein